MAVPGRGERIAIPGGFGIVRLCPGVRDRYQAVPLVKLYEDHGLLAVSMNGSSDYMSWNVSELDHVVRWILIHPDQAVAGMALPSTCDPDGYTREKQKGNVRSVPPMESVTFSVNAGYLDGPRTKEMERRIRDL